MITSDVALLSLHGLRLKGFAETTDVAELYGIDRGALARQLADQEADQLVVHRQRVPSGWTLTATGRRENDRLLATELDTAGARAGVQRGYEAFCSLNGRALTVCTRWQVRDPDNGVLNDHADAGYDRAVVEALVALDTERHAVTADLAGELDRFAVHGPRLTHAVEQVAAGDHDWFTRPLLASFHTVWFELHEDLLATLGLDRAAESGRTRLDYQLDCQLDCQLD